MSQKHDKLVTLLKELFQIDQPDLDFGIYRVLHAKSAEVTQFLDKDLLPQIGKAFEQYRSADRAELEKELATAVEQAKGLGADPDATPKVQELKSKIANESVDISKLESEVYDHLYSFFRRYYSEGDFLSKRVYKPGVYAIPYEGEEVKLHWANADQYYIKTSEYLRDFAFRLNPFADEEKGEDPMRVHFRLADAAEGEHGNVKESGSNKRVFVLSSGDEWIFEENGELVIRFEYRPATLTDWPEDEREGKKKPPAQKDLLEIAEKRILSVENAGLLTWVNELRKPHIKADGTESEKSRIRVNLERYTARNTFDYFIHKDLGGFLRRELDFYIKNEVMHLDDIESDTAPRVEQYLSKIKVIRSIAHKIIDFLAQLEDFQKKLWLKKKFVVETNYCVSLDLIPETLHEEIECNLSQINEWKATYGVTIEGSVSVANLVQHNQNLILDTAFFSDKFKEAVASSLSDDEINGLLIHSDNFQALRLTQHVLRERVKCVYIDPPYNTASSSIPYKNDYKHSSFATMIYDRLSGLSRTLTADGAIFVSIDKTERQVVQFTLDEVFGGNNFIEELIWSMNTNNSQAPNYSTNHEYVLVYAKDRQVAEQDRYMFREPKPGYEEVMQLIEALNPAYPSIKEIENSLKQLYGEHVIEYREKITLDGLDWSVEQGNDPWKGLFNYNRAEYRDQNGKLVAEHLAASLKANIWVWREGDMSMPATKQSASTKDPTDPNYRFYHPPHPITGKACPPPKRGWNAPYRALPGQRSFSSIAEDNRIVWGENEKKIPQIKRFLHEAETNVGKSVFVDYSDGEKQTSAMFGRSGVFFGPQAR